MGHLVPRFLRGFLARGVALYQDFLVAPLPGRLGLGKNQPPRRVGKSGEAIHRVNGSTSTASAHSMLWRSKPSVFPPQVSVCNTPNDGLAHCGEAWGFVD